MSKYWSKYPNYWPPVNTSCVYMFANGERHKVKITAHGHNGICFIREDRMSEYYVDMRCKNPDIFEPVHNKSERGEADWCDVARAIMEGDMNPDAPPKGDLRRLYWALKFGLLKKPE